MASPILWAPGTFCFFLQENLHAHKILVFGGYLGFVGGWGSADFMFMGAGIFLKKIRWRLSSLVREPPPPHIAQYLCKIASRRGYRIHFSLVSCGIAQVSLARGLFAPQVHISWREDIVHDPPTLRHPPRPYFARYGGVAEIVSQKRELQGHYE